MRAAQSSLAAGVGSPFPTPPAARADARRPFGDHPEGTSRQAATENGQRIDVDENLVLTILGVKVRRVVVVVEDPDHDVVEAADLRHAGSGRAR